MTKNSFICRLIAETTDWEQKIHDKNINIHKDGALAIFNYGPGCDWSDPVVCEARGIIIDTEKAEVMCWPFSKFFNVEQTDFAAKIYWTGARVQEKVDGSIVKLWNHPEKGWVFSTNSVMFAETADVHGVGNFLELIKSAPEYGKILSLINKGSLVSSLTYIFELTSPENRVVIRYEEPHLWHIGTRSRISGEEYAMDIGIQRPKEYTLFSLEACLNTVKMLNAANKVCPEHEGFVVVDNQWNRIKIKTPEYLELHATLENRAFSKDHILRLLLEGKDVEPFCKSFPEHEVFFRYYQFKLAELRYKGDQVRRRGLVLYKEYDHDIKAVAQAIKNDPLSSFAFQAIRKGKTAEEVIKEMSLKAIEKLIPEYDCASIVCAKTR